MGLMTHYYVRISKCCWCYMKFMNGYKTVSHSDHQARFGEPAAPNYTRCEYIPQHYRIAASLHGALFTKGFMVSCSLHHTRNKSSPCVNLIYGTSKQVTTCHYFTIDLATSGDYM